MSISLLNNTLVIACLNTTDNLLLAASKAAENVGLIAGTVPDCDVFSFQAWKLVCSTMSPDVSNDDDPGATDNDDDANGPFSDTWIGFNDTDISLIEGFGSQACQADSASDSNIEMIAIAVTAALLTCCIFYCAMASYCSKRKMDGKPTCLSLPRFWSKAGGDEGTPINGDPQLNAKSSATCCWP